MHGRSSREIAAGALRRWRDRLRRESGQSLVVVVAAMLVLLATAAIGIGMAELLAAHHRAQVAADAGALAAAEGMETTTNSEPTTLSMGSTMATNDDQGSTATISEPDGTDAKAQVSAPVSIPFGSLFGLGSATVSAHATAHINQATTNITGGDIGLQTACDNDESSPCTYSQGQCIPTNSANQCTGNYWQVTDAATDPTTNGPGGSSTAGETTVNIQTCDGTTASAYCYAPGSTTPLSEDPSDDTRQVVDLNGQSQGGMWQTVPTVPGAEYVLSFWLTGNPALDGWPGSQYYGINYFPLDVYITNGSGSGAQFTPSMSSGSLNEYENPSSPSYPPDGCNATHPSDYVDCGYWDYSDEICGASGVSLTGCTNGQEQADFTVESLSFVAQGPSTTITFNSEVYDDDQMDGNDGWFNCGPEVADITFGPPDVELSQ